MRQTDKIADPSWLDIQDRDKRIAELEAENERLRHAITGLLSWCEEISGDNLDKNAAAHEMATVQQAIDAMEGK